MNFLGRRKSVPKKAFESTAAVKPKPSVVRVPIARPAAISAITKGSILAEGTGNFGTGMSLFANQLAAEVMCGARPT